jgi:molybdenum cofactor biosynthesis protein B
MMAGIDEGRVFLPVRIAVLTVSDTRDEASDRSGGLLVERIGSVGHELVAKAIVRDEVDEIQAQLRTWIADPKVEVVITTGGTGFSPRDVTPEAVRPLFDREMDGFSTVFHHVSMGTVGVSTLQSRACAGQADGTFIFCLPGSTGGCRDGWDLVLANELDSRYRPCSLVSHIPRLATA